MSLVLSASLKQISLEGGRGGGFVGSAVTRNLTEATCVVYAIVLLKERSGETAL